jgi:uroporphyrinogen-III decarboxylase
VLAFWRFGGGVKNKMKDDPFVDNFIRDLEKKVEDVTEDSFYEVFELVETLKKDRRKS